MCQPQPRPLSTPTLKAGNKEFKPPKKRKAKLQCKIITKIAMKTKET